MDKITRLQNLNDRLFKLLEIMNYKLENGGNLNIQVMLLEDVYEEMRVVLMEN
jgi:hypothetical protein